MNAGFGKLDFLKRRLLLASDAATDAHDEAVLSIGLTVAGYIEGQTDRVFSRLAGATIEAPAVSRYIVVPRYPIESVAGLAVRRGAEDAWEEVGWAYNMVRDAGIVSWIPQSDEMAVVRVTYTGGYWWAADDGDVMPGTAAKLPDALMLAWVQGCKYLWDRQSIEERTKAGFAAGEQIEAFITGESQFPQFVRDVLTKYRRMMA